MDLHHGGAYSYPGHFGLESTLVFTSIVANIGGGTAHIKSDQLFKSSSCCGLHHTHHTTGRTGQDRIFALEVAGICQTTI